MSTTKPKAGGRSKGAKSADKAPGKSVSKTKTSSSADKKSAKRARLEKAVSRVDIDKLGALPHSYGTNSIFLAAQEPRWLFTYWDIDISRHPGGPCILRVEDESGAIDQEISVPFETRNWYVPVKEAGKKYTVEIGFYRGKSWNTLARSLTVTTPRDRISESDRFDYATIPLHIGFQRLVETITSSMSFEQNLVPALAELQRSVVHGGSSAYPLQANERAILATLLGSEFLAELSSAQWGSEELHSAIRARLQERLGSGELGELLARLQLGQMESSLFSMFSKLGAEMVSASGNLSSAGLAEQLAAGLSSWLSSWSAGAPGGLAALSSGALSSGALAMGGASSGALAGALSSGALSSGALSMGGASSGILALAGALSSGALSMGGASSGALALAGALSSGALSMGGASSGALALAGALSSGALMSWAGGASETIPFNLTSWAGMETNSAETLASWNQLSSWLSAVGSSWSGINLSSFEQAVLSSWSSSAMSSWEAGASSSWGSSENSFGLAVSQPSFQLSAEIIVRGRTNPRNRVLVDGQYVEVHDDGSFEHRVLVSGERGSVPIEALGPDGKPAQRSLILLQPATI